MLGNRESVQCVANSSDKAKPPSNTLGHYFPPSRDGVNGHPWRSFCDNLTGGLWEFIFITAIAGRNYRATYDYDMTA